MPATGLWKAPGSPSGFMNLLGAGWGSECSFLSLSGRRHSDMKYPGTTIPKVSKHLLQTVWERERDRESVCTHMLTRAHA